MVISKISMGGDLKQSRPTMVVNMVMGLLMIGLAVFILAKYHKKEGFWYGFLVLLLLGSVITVSDNKKSTVTDTTPNP